MQKRKCTTTAPWSYYALNLLKQTLLKCTKLNSFEFDNPHLQQTKLCDMNDADLDPGYVEKREKLKEIVGSIARPKIVHIKALNDKEFVSYLKHVPFYIANDSSDKN